MPRTLLVLSFLGIFTLLACAKPVPAEKAEYIGIWDSPTMTLFITQEGNIVHRYQENGDKKSRRGSLKGFEGNNLKVGFNPFSTTMIEITKPPYQEGSMWKMVVSGVELTKMP